MVHIKLHILIQSAFSYKEDCVNFQADKIVLKMVNDILESLSPDKYIELSGILERQLPRSICAVYLLKNLIEWRKIKHNFNNFEWGQPEIGVDMKKIRVYVPKSGMQNGTFIIINELNVNFFIMRISSPI